VEVFHLVFPTIFYGDGEASRQKARDRHLRATLKAAYKQVCISPSLREFKDLDG